MILNSVLKKISKKYNDSGLIGLLVLIIKRSNIFKYFVIFYFYRISLISLIKEVKRPPNVSVIIIKSNEMLEEILKVQDKRDIFRARLIDEGVFVILLYYDGVPVGYVWGQLHSPHYEERYGFVVEFEKEDVYYFDCYIDSAYRGLGLLKYLLNEFIRFAREDEGKKSMAAIIEKDNASSVKIHEGMGYKRIDLQLALSFFSRDFQFVLRKY